jgi:ubiquinone/menaquinone biosynthesis C-methylase UbiE
MNPSSKFWDRIAERYSERPVADEAAHQQKLQVTRTYFRPDSEVLEFGCGTGSTAISHSPYVRHIRAIDISSKMLEIAREKAEKEGVENVTFEQLTIEDVNVPDQSLDAVLGLSILHWPWPSGPGPGRCQALETWEVEKSMVDPQTF